jgi:hypothetical protein
MALVISRKYIIDQFIRRFKREASELTLQCIEEKEIGGRKGR